MKPRQLTANNIVLPFHMHLVKHINNPVGRYRHRKKCMHCLHTHTKHKKYEFSRPKYLSVVYLGGVQ